MSWVDFLLVADAREPDNLLVICYKNVESLIPDWIEGLLLDACPGSPAVTYISTSLRTCRIKSNSKIQHLLAHRLHSYGGTTMRMHGVLLGQELNSPVEMTT